MSCEEWLAQNKKWTIDENHSWCESNAAELKADQAQYQRIVDDIVTQSVVILRKQGMSLDEAGDLIMRSHVFFGTRGGVFVTRDAAKRTLRKLLCRSKAELGG